MAAITKIEFWKDVGFLEGAIEIPRLDAPDPVNPDLTIEPDQPIIPSRERFFTKLKIKEYYDELMEMSYIRLTYELNDKTMIFYGWVRDISLESDGDLPVTVIDWHIDEWRTWKSSVTFGSGHVKRRPFRDLATTPIQNYGKIYRKFGSRKIDLFTPPEDSPGYPVWFIVFSYNTVGQDADGNDYITGTQIGCFPTNVGGPTLAKYDGTDQSYSLRPSEVDKGWLTTVFNIRPTTINGIWFTDIPPTDAIVRHSNGYWYENSGDWDYVRKQYNGTWYGYFTGSPRNYSYHSDLTFAEPVTADEQHQYSIVGIDGNIIYSLPYGMTVTKVTSGLIITPTSCNQLFRFDFDGIYENRNSAIGLLAMVPCPMIPVLSNAWSEYNFSGERQYDIDMRKLQTETGAVKQIAAGVGTGSMMGAFGPGGLLIGGAGGAVGGTTNYLVETFWQNDKEQEILDRMKANQSPNILMSGSSCIELVAHNTMIALYEFVPDDYSDQQIIATRNQFGISVDELMSSCDQLIRSTSPTGYYNIQNMIVNGNVPVSAKKWIREKFRSGVRLI